MPKLRGPSTPPTSAKVKKSPPASPSRSCGTLRESISSRIGDRHQRTPRDALKNKPRQEELHCAGLKEKACRNRGGEKPRHDRDAPACDGVARDDERAEDADRRRESRKKTRLRRAEAPLPQDFGEPVVEPVVEEEDADGEEQDQPHLGRAQDVEEGRDVEPLARLVVPS